MAPDELLVTAGAATDVGRVRRINEDRYLAASPVYLVADGMGGHDAGERASTEAVETLRSLVGTRGITPQHVFTVVAEARTRVVAIATRPGRDAGTTLSGVVVTHQDGAPYWLVMNVGDSRTYLLADGVLEQISVDHSEVQELIDSGGISRSEADRHPLRHVVTRALGAGGYSDADFWLLPIGCSDRILICSDGLTGELDDDEIRDVLTTERPPQAAADRLVQMALDRGGRDNVTVVVVDGEHGVVQDRTAPRQAGLRPAEEPDGDTNPSSRPTYRRP